VGPGVSEKRRGWRTDSGLSLGGPWAEFGAGPKGFPGLFLIFFFYFLFYSITFA
jgi:hypothetical protein